MFTGTFDYDFFEVNAFKHQNKPIYGIQADPEATPLFIKHLKQEIPQSEDYMLCESDFLIVNPIF